MLCRYKDRYYFWIFQGIWENFAKRPHIRPWHPWNRDVQRVSGTGDLSRHLTQTSRRTQKRPQMTLIIQIFSRREMTREVDGTSPRDTSRRETPLYKGDSGNHRCMWGVFENTPWLLKNTHGVFRETRGVSRKSRDNKKSPDSLLNQGFWWKMAASYSPALHCSTIGAGGLNFSVRNGKRWDPAAITTW